MAHAPIHTRRWDDPPGPADGTRILITRYRPRGLARSAETWTEWLPALAPSPALHAAAYGKAGVHGSPAGPLDWATYRTAYLREMRSASATIDALAARVAAGETVTLLCSSQCVRESRCHRSLLRELLLVRLAGPADAD